MHNQYVINNCPKDKLLVWKLEDGWEPVAKFLGKPVPKGPLPHKNRLGGVIQDLENSPDYQVENRSRQTNLSFCGVIWICRKISENFWIFWSHSAFRNFTNFSVEFGFLKNFEYSSLVVSYLLFQGNGPKANNLDRPSTCHYRRDWFRLVQGTYSATSASWRNDARKLETRRRRYCIFVHDEKSLRILPF